MNAPMPVAQQLATIPAFAMTEPELLAALESSLYPGVKTDTIKLIVSNCRAQLLDPFTKPFHGVPMQVKQKKKDANGNLTNKVEYVWRDVVMPGIELYRVKAARTGEYAGIDDGEFGPEITKELGGEKKLEWDEQIHAKVDSGKTYEKRNVTFPEWCRVTVYRFVQGQKCSFSSGKVYWEESYATAGNETSLPNAMWSKRDHGQLEKCAEALALRRAFPELVGAAPVIEEMAGKVIDATAGMTIDNETGQVVPGPSAKSAGKAEQPAAAEHAPPKEPAENASAGGAASAGEQPLLTDGERNHIKLKLEDAGLTEVDLRAQFTKGLAELTKADFKPVKDWVAGKA